MKILLSFLLSAVVLLKFGVAQVPGEYLTSDGESRSHAEAITEILDHFVVGYDKRIRPNFGGSPVEVGVTMYVLSIPSLSESDMDFTMDFYFRQIWNDPRLKFNGPNGLTTIFVPPEWGKNSLWLPDTFFANDKQSYAHTITTPNEFIRISSDGEIMRSIRITVTASCPMDLRLFPFDRQLCSLEIESFGFSMSDICYKWAKGDQSVGVAAEASLPAFKILGFRQRTQQKLSPGSGNYSRLTTEIQFVRAWRYYLIRIYLPVEFLVIISWLSFWLDRNSIFARVLIGITSVLMILIMVTVTNDHIPKISYWKAIDEFLIVCFLMAFSALIETVVVAYIKKRIQMRQKVQTKDLADESQQTQDGNVSAKICHYVSASDVDKCSRVAFPLIFILYNFYYWIFHLSLLDVVEHDLVLLND